MQPGSGSAWAKAHCSPGGNPPPDLGPQPQRAWDIIGACLWSVLCSLPSGLQCKGIEGDSVRRSGFKFQFWPLPHLGDPFREVGILGLATFP